MVPLLQKQFCRNAPFFRSELISNSLLQREGGTVNVLQNIDKVTHPCNTYVDVLQSCFVETQNYALQMNVVTHRACFIKLCYKQQL